MNLFERTGKPALIGVVHLLALPGAPRGSRGLDAVRRRAVDDADALAGNGCDAIILENLGDAPFTGGRVDAWTVAAMTALAMDIRGTFAGPIGINVLRNDPIAALSIANAVGASFIRVNVHTGAMLTDQGVIEGAARETLLERNRLGGDVKIAADVQVKHAVPLAPQAIGEVAADTADRGGADVLIVSGRGTGKPTAMADLIAVRTAVSVPVWIGSGVTPDTAAAFGSNADALIVGTYFHEDSDLSRPVDPQRVMYMRRAMAG